MTPFLSRLFALCLALAWVPATAHCRLEALGLDLPLCAESCHGENAAAHDDAAAGHDGCALVEDGFYKAGVDPIKISPPLAVACVCLICEVTAEPPSSVDSDRATPGGIGRPREWVPQWHFVRRAAVPAHAPDQVSA